MTSTSRCIRLLSAAEQLEQIANPQSARATRRQDRAFNVQHGKAVRVVRRKPTLGEFELSSRLAAALRLANALNLRVSEFCRQFPYATLLKYRGFKRNTVAELVAILQRFNTEPDVAKWLAEMSPKIRTG